MKINISIVLCLLLIVMISAGPVSNVHAWYPRLDSQGLITDLEQGALVGKNRPYVTGWNETLMEVARRGGLGFSALVNANPGTDTWQPGFGRELVLPYAAIVPQGLHEGITVNLAEYRLYFIEREKEGWRVRIYPIGLGREGWQTPLGDYSITSLIDDPVWTRPETMRNGDPTIPNLIEAGPDNPLGSHWLGLSLQGYGIHGTNRPYGIGRRVSHGCIRLYQGDIADLAGRVRRGTAVKIIYRPVKIFVGEDRLWIEAHPDYLGRESLSAGKIAAMALRLGWNGHIDVSELTTVLSDARGVPVVVGVKD